MSIQSHSFSNLNSIGSHYAKEPPDYFTFHASSFHLVKTVADLMYRSDGYVKFKIDQNHYLYLKTNQTNYLTQLLYWHGGVEKFEYSEIFISLIKKVNVFYDIGANIGYYSLMAGILNSKINVVAFEPARGPLHDLIENVKINKLDNVRIESIALSDSAEGEIRFYEIKSKKYKYLKYNLAGEGNAGSKTTGRNFEINKVKTTTLDNYVHLNAESSVDLIKMDTEGTEHMILQKAEYVLGTLKPIIICEVLFDCIEAELDEIIKSYDYELYGHVDEGLVKLKTLKRNEDNGIRNCFFVPKSKTDLVQEYIL